MVEQTGSARLSIPFIRYAVGVLLITFLMTAPHTLVHAQQRPFGAGIIIGDPTGFTAKYWKNKENAYDFGLAWALGDNGSVLIYGDYIWHRFEITGEARTPLYFGVGAWFGANDNRTGLGARIPLGVTHLFARDPIDVFFEIVPAIRIVPDTDLDVQGGFGIRYYFKSSSRK
ncbi:MAG: hypothetical protein KTR29_18745 [Rhodothermaceae bacterium]|nr:hypothetical protein [Rhodothermaceae bacterium]